jgi:ribonuclease R
VTDKDLIRHIARSPQQRANYKQLVRELGLGGGRERRLLLEHLARLTMRGELTKLDKDQWQIPQATTRDTPARPRSLQDAVSGRLDLHRDGYGFVRPQGGKGREDDIFIPPPALNGAMQGDQVMVELDRAGSDGRRSGRILRVLTRKNATVVGIFHYGSAMKTAKRRRHQHPSSRRSSQNFDERFAVPPGFHWLAPLDERMTQPVLIPFGDEVPVASSGKQAQPHRTLGHAEEPVDWSEIDLDGLAVDVEITDFPTTTRPARGRVVEVLGEPDDFGVDVEIVIRKHHLPHIFPDSVLAEAKAASEVPVELAAGREDFRHLPIVTIDGETARDFDDAVLVRPLRDGITELQVHIADVSHYVTPGSALDLEARVRGTSVYFPDRAVPMLPHELSSGACSLRPDEDRFVLSAVLHFDQEGNRVGYEITKGVIRSASRMTYTQVAAILDGDAAMREQFAALVPEFERMYAFARVLNRKRQQRGSIDFDLPEPSIEFDEQGQMRGIVKSERNWAHRLIEEFMLAANECVASHMEAAGVPAMYRIHEKPEPAKILEFEEAAAAFGYSLGVGSIPVKRFSMKNDRREQQRRGSRGFDKKPVRGHEVAQDVYLSPKMYQKLAAQIAGKPEERILSYLMLRSLKQARYSEKNEGHFALAAESYTHFTSPIRRYPDLIVHRVLSALLEQNGHVIGFSPDKSARIGRRASAPETELPLEEVAAIAQESSEAERRADDAERELIEWKKMRFMQDRIGEQFDGIVLSVTKFGMFVELKDMFLEGLVPLASLSDLGERFLYRENTRQMIGEDSGRRFAIGDEVTVLLDKINQQERRLVFAVVEKMAPRAAREQQPSQPSMEHAFAKFHSAKPKRSKGKARQGKRNKKPRR